MYAGNCTSTHSKILTEEALIYGYKVDTLSMQSTHHKEKQTYRLNVYIGSLPTGGIIVWSVENAECKMCFSAWNWD